MLKPGALERRKSSVAFHQQAPVASASASSTSTPGRVRGSGAVVREPAGDAQPSRSAATASRALQASHLGCSRPEKPSITSRMPSSVTCR